MNQTLFLFIGGIGTTELILIVLAVLLLFGGKKIPELMRGLGKGIREFNAAKANIETEVKEGIRHSERPEATRLQERTQAED
jgi:sec-independent protein translocase protein TatA